MKKLALCLALGVLAGCATNDSVTAPGTKEPVAVYHSLQTLNYQPLRIYDEAIQQTVRLTDQSAVLKTPDSHSGVVAWQLPKYGAYRFKVISQIQRSKFGREASAFMAEVQLLDQAYQVIKTLPAASLSYQKPGLLEQEYFYHSFVVDNRDPLLTPVEYMVVTMTDKGRQQTIQVIDQDKEYARVRGTLPPATADIMATAAENGTVILEAMAMTSAYTPSLALASAYVPPVETGTQKKLVASSKLDTVAVSRAYRKEVQMLLEKQDIAAALQMRLHVKALSDELQAEFAALYGKKRGDVPSRDLENLKDESLEQQLSVTHKQQLMAYLNAGDTQSALRLLDQVKTLSLHVDRLF